MEVFQDTGSGLNCRKPGLVRLIKRLLSGTVKELVLTYRDRLLRFGSEIIFLLCRQFNITVTILQEDAVSKPAMEVFFCEDVLSIITVFSARLYGARSHRNRKAIPTTQLCAT